MEAGICLQNYIPMRAEPSERSEMVSQVLFGEHFELLEKNKKTRFTRIKLHFDGYEGWIDHKTINFLDDNNLKDVKELEETVVRSLYIHLHMADGSRKMIGGGSNLWLRSGKIIIPENITGFDDDILQKQEDQGKELIERSMLWLGIPYIWGGRSVFGADCSGFVQNLFKQSGIRLPRDARDQALRGTTISFHTETRAGDLAFFENDEGMITHTGIITGDGRIIHSSGKVRIDHFDQQGIYSPGLGTYSHKLRLIKRVIQY